MKQQEIYDEWTKFIEEYKEYFSQLIKKNKLIYLPIIF